MRPAKTKRPTGIVCGWGASHPGNESALGADSRSGLPRSRARVHDAGVLAPASSRRKDCDEELRGLHGRL